MRIKKAEEAVKKYKLLGWALCHAHSNMRSLSDLAGKGTEHDAWNPHRGKKNQSQRLCSDPCVFKKCKGAVKKY